MHELRELQFVKIFKLKLKSAMHALDITLLGLWLDMARPGAK